MGNSINSRLLTPNDVDEKDFKTIGLFKRGYDADQVDEFLESVKLTIKALGDEITRSRSVDQHDTQSISPEITKLNNKIGDLSSALEALKIKYGKLEEENSRLQSMMSTASTSRPYNPMTGQLRSR